MPRGALNIHPSLLPELRGPSPLAHAILNNLQRTGVSFMLMDSGMDSGPILQQIPFSLDSNETLETLSEKVADIAGKHIIGVIRSYAEGALHPTVQDATRVSFCPLLRKEDGEIDWSKKALEIERMIRALNPWPGTFTVYQGIRIKIHRAHVGNDGPFCIPCGENTFLSLDLVQPAGKKIMSGDAFLRGLR